MRFIDLFAGVGGFRRGLEQANQEEGKLVHPRGNPEGQEAPVHGRSPEAEAGDDASPDGGGEVFRCVWSCEVDRWCRAVYRYHWGETPAGDARKVRPDDISDFDLLCAGFPCQSFSVAGKRKGFRDPRGTLFYEICRIARAKRPRLLLLENVEGLLSVDRGETFGAVLQELGNLGYGVEWQVLNSKGFGVPQSRPRVFIVGHLGGIRGREVFPIAENDRVDNQTSKTNGETVPCLEATGYKGVSSERFYGVAEGEPMTLGQTNPHSPAEERRFRLSKTARSIKAEWSSQQQPLVVMPVPLKFLGRNQRNYDPDTTLTVDTCNTTGVAIFDRANAVMKTECGTLRAAGTHGRTGFDVVDGVRIRRFTPREQERFQGFPDDWTRWGLDEHCNKIVISDTQRYKMMGNAVTVNVIEFLAKRLPRMGGENNG